MLRNSVDEGNTREQEENTLITVVADNGPMMDQHRMLRLLGFPQASSYADAHFW
jgi:arylsulfatase A-like enzyme